MNKEILTLITVLFLIVLGIFVLQNSKKVIFVKSGECIIENNTLTCGRSYRLVTQGIGYDVKINTPFNLFDLPDDSFLLGITEQKLYKRLLALSNTDNPGNLSNVKRVEKVKDEYTVETGRQGIYFINKMDGQYLLGEKQNAEAVKRQLLELRK